MPNNFGPLDSGARIVVIGGGPGGAGAALALDKMARASGKRLDITLFEGKVFANERHFNQCVGVLSPPIETILREHLDVSFPVPLVQRQITGYMLHSDDRALLLESDDPPAFAVRRIQFDNYLLEETRKRGINVISSRVIDLEFHADRVIVYSESGNKEADVVIGAFGSDDGTAVVFERATSYRSPKFLSSIVTKIHPGDPFMDAFGNYIHAFLPSTRGIEFGAVTPKGNHLTINIAGEHVDATAMQVFLHSSAPESVLPCLDTAQATGDLDFFKGRFPISQARSFSGDRYVIVGDAAGLVRPFKGKGVNSALLTGIWAAKTLMTRGISANAFRSYHELCREITDDLPYGKAMRAVAMLMSKWRLLNLVLALAQEDDRLHRALFDAVSAHKSYRSIVQSLSDPVWLVGMGIKLATLPRRPQRSVRKKFAGRKA